MNEAEKIFSKNQCKPNTDMFSNSFQTNFFDLINRKNSMRLTARQVRSDKLLFTHAIIFKHYLFGFNTRKTDFENTY